MKKLRSASLIVYSLQFITATALAVIPEPPPRAASPFELAMVLEQNQARFIALCFPVTNLVLKYDYGVLPMPSPAPDGFPLTFVEGLIPTEEYGFTVFPVTLKVDEPTGNMVFHDVNTNAFHTVPANASYHPEWILDLFGRTSPYLEEILRPSKVDLIVTFVAEEDMADYNAARIAARMKTYPSQGSTWPANKPKVDITAFEASSNAFYFASAWNAVAYFPLSRMDILYKPDLNAPAWAYVKSVPVPKSGGTRAALFDIPRVELPRPPFTHDELCAPVTNIVFSSLDAGMTYTNLFCECVAPPIEFPAGFFRLSIPDPSVNAPAWWRVLYGFAPFDSWEDYIDFTLGGLSNIDKYEQGENPIIPPPALNASSASIIYLYDEDDRLDATFIADEGAAAIRYLSPAGNPDIQQERTAP